MGWWAGGLVASVWCVWGGVPDSGVTPPRWLAALPPCLWTPCVRQGCNLLSPLPLPLPPLPTCPIPTFTARAELYKQYLMYSMSGDVVELPVGGVIRKKNSAVTQQAEMARLGQLGDILGMTPLEVRAVQQDLAGQAFKQQVRGSGRLKEWLWEYGMQGGCGE